MNTSFKNTTNLFKSNQATNDHSLQWTFKRNFIITLMMSPTIILPFLLLLLMQLESKSTFNYLFAIPADVMSHLKHKWLKIKPPESKAKVKQTNRTSRKSLMKTLMILSTIPVTLRGKEINLSNQLKAFVNTDGIVQTRKLPSNLITDMKGLLRENVFEEMVDNKDLSTGIIDSGSSLICTPFEKDFKAGTLKPLVTKKSMGGISGKLDITHSGITDYQTTDTKGIIVLIQKTGYLVPGLPARLLPPQKLMNDDDGEWYRINNKRAELEFKGGQIVKTPFDQRSKLPYIFLFKRVDDSIDSINTSMYTCISKESNQNLSPIQREALRYHWRLGHTGLHIIRWLSNRGLLSIAGNRIGKGITKEDCPFCATCSYGKQTCNPTNVRSHNNVQQEKHLNINRLEPGSMIAVDQLR